MRGERRSREKRSLSQASESGVDAKVKGTRKSGGVGKRKKEKGKRKGERAQFPAPSLPRFLPFHFRVRAFLIQQARLTRSLDRTGYEKRGRGGHNLSSFLPLIYIIFLSISPRVALRKKDDRPRSNLSYCRKIVTQTCWVSSMTAFA